MKNTMEEVRMPIEEATEIIQSLTPETKTALLNLLRRIKEDPDNSITLIEKLKDQIQNREPSEPLLETET